MRLVVFILGFLWSLPSFSQDSTGFYMVVHVKKKSCQKFLESLDGKRRFCLAPEPIITRSEFLSVSEIKNDQKFDYISLTLSLKGFNQYKAISSKLKGTEMALVIENKVVGIFNSEGKTPKRTIQIGENISVPDLQWVHDKLK